MQDKTCKYNENVHCELAKYAPYCDQLCELNEEAKKHFEKMNSSQNQPNNDKRESFYE